ncbi:MAG: hypothetical protein J0H29_16420 [Sphingobacteriales bacterium]|nr:hypothetical protein [Sphingobacteriales bacterium]OJY91857.1 MAG: hypothetical protein BGP14_23290 [Sphingobacteriales bacterium 44-15]
MNKSRNITISLVKNSLFVLAVFATVQYVFAVSGIRLNNNSSGDDKVKSAETSSGFSNLKSSVTFSLKDSYRIPTKNNCKLGILDAPAIKSQNTNTSLVSFKKGNITYILPYKTQPGVKLPSFLKLSPTPVPAR